MLLVLVAGAVSSAGAAAPPISMWQLAESRLLDTSMSAAAVRAAPVAAPLSLARQASQAGGDLLEALLTERSASQRQGPGASELQQPREVPQVPVLQSPRRLRWTAAVGDGNVTHLSEASLIPGLYFKKPPVIGDLASESLMGRQLTEKKPCSNHSGCTPNEYCMNCEKCLVYHRYLDRDQQKRWTCEPCDIEGGSHCESGRYCSIAKDSVDGQCPSFAGCATHSECPVNEYCFSCEACQKYVAETGRRDIWECQPCPTDTGGFCGISAWCAIKQDGIDGECPQTHGCDKHEECWNSQYCESCTQCQAFLNSLPKSQQGQWSCAPCPTAGGGFCEELVFCQVANDGIDGTCPEHRGCNSHVQCLPDEYCMDCQQCATFRDSLADDMKDKWSCEPCPTRRGGACGPRQFCTVGEDSIEGYCPEFTGCGAHSECGKNEFCLSWQSCTEELDLLLCGSKPVKGGLCMRADLCKHKRSIDGHCPVPLPCQGHEDCTKGYFCAAWADCAQRQPVICGPRPMHRDGICLPLEHCIRGLHAPMDGSCPADQRQGGTLVIREGLKLNGSMQLAVHHQALNVWPMPIRNRPSLHAAIEDYPGVVFLGATGPRGEVVVEVQSNSSGNFLHVHYDLRGLAPSARGGLHVHVGMSCFANRSVGGHFWHAAGPRSDPWEDASWTSNSSGNAVGNFTLQSGYGFRQNSGRAVVVHAPDGSRIGCGILAEESVLAQLHDYGNESSEDKKRHNDMEFVGIYKVASGQLREESHVKLSCPSVEVAVPSRAGIFVEARIHLTEFEMSMTHSECSCVRGENDGACPRGVEYLTPEAEKDKYVRRHISKLYPVLFVDEAGLPQPNQLTLYSMTEQVSVPAVLVDSTLGSGEGEASLGCPFIQDIGAPVSKLPTLTTLRSGSKVLKSGHVTKKWCVVRLGPPSARGCSVTAKYKFCVVGGARGVILMAEEGDDKDQTAEIFLRQGEELKDMVPVLFIPHERHLLESLAGGEFPTITVGPNVAVDPPENFVISEGGLRVYDTETSQWYQHTGLFGTQEWMEFSPVRDVLFVCTSQHKILAIDASNPTVEMPLLGSPDLSSMPFGGSVPECHTAPLFRDYHTADVRQGDRFFTVLVDPGETTGNRLHFFDTTDLSSWKYLSEVHANWEHENSGLGQVVAAPDGKRLLVTWHCSTLYCGSSGQGRGERLYILDLEKVASGEPPPLLAVLDLAMSEGSFVRDVACNIDNICLASLTWDGVIAIDISDGPNRHQIVAQHSATFQGPAVPAHIAYVRMASGAQKVVASQTKMGRFYVERWNLDADKFLMGKRLSECLRFDSIWVLDLEGYTRPVNPLPVSDPAVHAKLTLSISMETLLGRVHGGKIDDVERMVAVALQHALNIDGHRLIVTGARSSTDRSSVVVSFHIVPGDGASPVTLYNALLQQLETEGSAIHTGVIAPYTPGAQLTATTAVAPGLPSGGGLSVSDSSPSAPSSARQNAQGSSESHMLVMLCVTAVCVMITVWAVAFAWRSRRTAALATARANAIARQNPPGPVGLMLQAHAEAPSSGYAIGRPADTGAGAANTAAAAAGPAASAYVVGTPVAPGSAAAGAEGAVAGTTLTQMDTQKLAADGGSSGSGSVLAPQAGAAAPAVSAGVAAAAVSAGVAAGAGSVVAAGGIQEEEEDSEAEEEDPEEEDGEEEEQADGQAEEEEPPGSQGGSAARVD